MAYERGDRIVWVSVRVTLPMNLSAWNREHGEDTTPGQFTASVGEQVRLTAAATYERRGLLAPQEETSVEVDSREL